MIELKNCEVKVVSGGFYYTALGTAVGGISTASWIASMADRQDFFLKEHPTILTITAFFGMMGAVFGSVVGGYIDHTIAII